MKQKILVSLFSIFGITACAQLPDGAVAIKPFDANRYLGTWYEIARFDFHFERNLINVTANYSLKPDGTIRVSNRGYNTVKTKWSEAIGKAKFAGDSNVASLKVSFFGPFYGAYNVVDLDADYKYTFVVGSNTNYMWILSREKTIPEAIKQQYLLQAQKLGFDLNKLIWTEQD
jgi:apolipoprotein D and lipocalin family protein